jgi:hypothetical protein
VGIRRDDGCSNTTSAKQEKSRWTEKRLAAALHLVLDGDGALGVHHHVRDGDGVGVHAGAPRHRLDECVLLR